jgi:hypothetical protein
MTDYYLGGRLEVEEADSIRTAGRSATLLIGPFGFHVSTADAGFFSFGVRIGRHTFGWLWEGNDEGA